MKKILLLLILCAKFLFADTHAVAFIYHHFGEERFPSTNIRIEQFQAQLDYLEQNRYNVWPLSKIVHYLKNRYSLPKNTVALTIDDAYISVYKNAYPMLKQKGFPYTVFVNTNGIGKNAKNYMTWEQMQEMQRYGAEFANHSSTHDYLTPKKGESTLEFQERIKGEVENAQSALQENLGNNTNENPKLLSYPFGEYTKESAGFIESLGYVGVAQTSGAMGFESDFKALPRFAMAESFAHMEGFVTKLGTLPLPLQKAEPFEPIVEQNPPKLSVKLLHEVPKLGCYTSNGERIAVEWISPTEFVAQAPQKLQPPRDRYTCTAPTDDGKFYWYSHLWIINQQEK